MKKLVVLILCLLSINIVAQQYQEINRTKINLTDTILVKYIGRYALDTDYHKTYTIQLENGILYATENDEEKIEITPDTETTFFDDPQSKDGYVFTLNAQTGKYNLTIILADLKLTAKRLQ